MRSPLSLHEPDQLALAESAGTPVEMLAELGRSRFTPVRRRVAMNDRTPDLVLDVLALDVERDVRSQAHLTAETKAVVELETMFALPSHERERPGATA